MSLDGKTVLITGGAKRIGRSIALAVAHAGGDLVIHYNRSRDDADSLLVEVKALGRNAFCLQGDLSDPAQASGLIERAAEHGPLFALVNNASIYEPLTWENTHIEDWNRTLAVNLTAPFLLSQAFARSLQARGTGRIVNLLDWRALRPRPDHLPYMISSAALAALTRSLAVALAPQVSVNGLALGVVLPPSTGAPPKNVLAEVPAQRAATLDEIGQSLIFLLDGPAYLTGEILSLDGGRHLV